MSLLWEHWPKARAVKEAILTFEPLCPKTFQLPLFPPKKSCVPATYFERRFLKTRVFNLSLSGKHCFLFTVEKIHPLISQVGHICEAHTRNRDDILVCVGRERERLESCKFVKANAAEGRRKCQEKFVKSIAAASCNGLAIPSSQTSPSPLPHNNLP